MKISNLFNALHILGGSISHKWSANRCEFHQIRTNTHVTARKWQMNFIERIVNDFGYLSNDWEFEL